MKEKYAAYLGKLFVVNDWYYYRPTPDSNEFMWSKQTPIVFPVQIYKRSGWWYYRLYVVGGRRKEREIVYSCKAFVNDAKPA